MSLAYEPTGKFLTLEWHDGTRLQRLVSEPALMSSQMVELFLAVGLNSELLPLLGLITEHSSSVLSECGWSIRLEVTRPPSGSGLTSTVKASARPRVISGSVAPGLKRNKVAGRRRERTS